MRILLLTLGISLVAATKPNPAPATELDWPRHSLVFSRHADATRSDYDIWTMCGDGTQLASWVVQPGHQFQMSVSPDGSEILYTSVEGDNRDIWRRPWGRGEAENVTDHPARDSEPVWSPDGASMVFCSNRDAEKLQLYQMNLSDGTVRRLTHGGKHDSGPAWSPHGGVVFFTRYFPGEEGGHSGAGEIFALDLASGEETQLTDLGGYNGGVSCSPDGGTLVFHRSGPDGAELWSMDVDGGDPHPLTATRLDEYSPAWSPDGAWIAYSAGTGNDGQGTFDLWIMRPDGSDARVLNRAPNTEAWQTWRPGHPCR